MCFFLKLFHNNINSFYIFNIFRKLFMNKIL